MNELKRLSEENAALRKAAIIARHELDTLHGLYAHDGNPEYTYRIDVSATCAAIDRALAREPLDVERVPLDEIATLSLGKQMEGDAD